MPRNTKKAEREALAKKRRKVRRGLKAHQKAKRKIPRTKNNRQSHPHRKTAALRQRRARP